MSSSSLRCPRALLSNSRLAAKPVSISGYNSCRLLTSSLSKVSHQCPLSRNAYAARSFGFQTSASFSTSADTIAESRVEHELTAGADACTNNVYGGSVALFGRDGMVTFKVASATFRKDDLNRYVTDKDGCVRAFFSPKADGMSTKVYDTSRAINVRLRPLDVAALIGQDLEKINPDRPPMFGSQFGAFTVMPGTKEDHLGLIAKKNGGPDEGICVEVPTAVMKTLQKSFLNLFPMLFGWHAVADPKLVGDFMSKTALEAIAAANAEMAVSTFFDD